MTTLEPPSLAEIQVRIQQATLPLIIRLVPSESKAFEDTDPYLIHAPRLSYLPSLIPRLTRFFAPYLIVPPPDEDAAGNGDDFQPWFSIDQLPLKWHFPIGLLYDLFSGAEPFSKGDDRSTADVGRSTSTKPDSAAWELTIHFSSFPFDSLVRLDRLDKVWEDMWVNSVKEADFLRNGTAKGIMSLSQKDSTRLWEAVRSHDYKTYNTINERLLSPEGGRGTRHLPIRFYLPLPFVESDKTSESQSEKKADAKVEDEQGGAVRILQPLVPPSQSSREPNTLGTMLHTILPSLFPSRRTATLARPVMHGAVVPLIAPVEDLYRVGAGYDGWASVVIDML